MSACREHFDTYRIAEKTLGILGERAAQLFGNKQSRIKYKLCYGWRPPLSSIMASDIKTIALSVFVFDKKLLFGFIPFFYKKKLILKIVVEEQHISAWVHGTEIFNLLKEEIEHCGKMLEQEIHVTVDKSPEKLNSISNYIYSLPSIGDVTTIKAMESRIEKLALLEAQAELIDREIELLKSEEELNFDLTKNKYLIRT